MYGPSSTILAFRVKSRIRRLTERNVLATRAGFSMLVLSVTVAISVVLGPAARAGVITQFESFTVGSGDILRFDRFDPALGELEEVRVRALRGRLTILGMTLWGDRGPLDLPTPYTYNVETELNVSRVTPGGFEFNGPMRFLSIGQMSPALGGSFAINYSFDFAFSFTELTDLVGFSLLTGSGFAVPPLSVVGLREDFVETAIFDDFLTFVLPQPTTSIGFGGPPAVVTDTFIDGVIRLDYVYDESSVDPREVPAPDTILLLTLGLAMVVGARRRRRS